MRAEFRSTTFQLECEHLIIWRIRSMTEGFGSVTVRWSDHHDGRSSILDHHHASASSSSGDRQPAAKTILPLDLSVKFFISGSITWTPLRVCDVGFYIVWW